VRFEQDRSARNRSTRLARLRAVLLASAAVAALWMIPSSGPLAQVSNFNDFIQAPTDGTVTDDMLVEADELNYDFDNDRVSAVGNVQIYYRGYTLQAQRVTLDRKTNRLIAEGSAKLVEPTGNAVEAETINLTDDFRDGFVRSLRVQTIERTCFASDKATREQGETTVFENGVYTAYPECAVDSPKPPLWQIRAKRITHKQSEKMVYYEGARLELWGTPIAYLPFLSHPDPSVKQKSGLLVPTYVYSEELGFGVSVPYHYVIAPNMDMTFTAVPLTRQGAFLQAEWRHRTANGEYGIQASGIRQADPNAFAGTSGDRDYRGMVRTVGEFYINPRWKWGWDVTEVTDRGFIKDYKREGNNRDEAISTIYLTGQGERNYFDVRAYKFQIFQEEGTGFDPLYLRRSRLIPGFHPAAFSMPWRDLQEKQPIVHPVLDYNVVFDKPVVGGELRLDTNVTSLTRWETDAYSILNSSGVPITRFRGVAGTFTRASVEMEWRREIIEPTMGHVITPFVAFRGDVFNIQNADHNVQRYTRVTALTTPGVEPFAEDGTLLRGMPSVGLEYRWPFLVTNSFGNQVFGPVGQIVARPDEARIGELPNEDAQSIVFDDTTLFMRDKFSGFDRTEGGTRANVGFEYRLHANNGGYISAIAGQSFHLAGTNSYATPDILNATVNSGLETDESDYVGGIYMDTGRGFLIGARGRFDRSDFETARAEIQATGFAGPVVSSVTYAFLRKQPDLGITDDREEIQNATSLRITDTWRVFGAVRYDLHNAAIVNDAVGLAYDDEGFSMSVAYSEDRSRFDGDTTDRTLFFRFGLRTIGDGQLSTDSLE